MSSGFQPCSQKDRKELGQQDRSTKAGLRRRRENTKRHHRNTAQSETASCSFLPWQGIATGQGKLKASGLSSLTFSDSLKFAVCVRAGASHMIQRAQEGSPGASTGFTRPWKHEVVRHPQLLTLSFPSHKH